MYIHKLIVYIKKIVIRFAEVILTSRQRVNMKKKDFGSNKAVGLDNDQNREIPVDEHFPEVELGSRYSQAV